MKTLKVLLQEVVSGIKAWVNSNFAQESNAVHKTGNETVNGIKTFTAITYKNAVTAFEDPGVSGYDYTPETYKSVDTFIHRGSDHIYWGGLKHNWLTDGTSQTRFAVTNYMYVNNKLIQGFWAVDLSADKDFSTVELIPSNSNVINLGSSSYQWNNVYAKRVNTQTLNGINPGALSLPRGYTEEGANKHYINITSVIQTLDGTIYNYTMPDNGWISVRAEQAQLVHVTIQSWNFGQCISHSTGSTLIVSVPFRKNDLISLKVKAVTLQYARFYPMQGNV